MPEAVMQPCAAAERPGHRALRVAAAALLVVFASLECTAAALIYAAGRGTAQLLYLLCSIGLFSASVVAVREHGRALTAVRALCIVTAVMLLWAWSAGPRPAVGAPDGRLHGLLPWLAAMLLASLLLPRLLRRPLEDTTCNCG